MTRILRKLLPEATINVSTDRPREGGLRLDNSQLVNELGFKPRFTLETALEDYIARVRAGRA